MTENAVRFLAKNELGHFSTARFWPGPSLDWRSPHWHLMGFLCYSSLVIAAFCAKRVQYVLTITKTYCKQCSVCKGHVNFAQTFRCLL